MWDLHFCFVRKVIGADFPSILEVKKKKRREFESHQGLIFYCYFQYGLLFTVNQMATF